MSPARRRERGFNQAEDLADGVAASLGLEVRTVLARDGGAGRQAGAGIRGRAANVQGRFRATTRAGVGLRRAILVDDVLTTGATALACVDALSQAGFTHIGVLTFARTLRTKRRPEHGSIR
ncbi:MAG: hypothetical protein R3195_14705 [Gemmatimonadota bacterium]|nr:hypothetical protein [Gemmatimonadota bacterium]